MSDQDPTDLAGQARAAAEQSDRDKTKAAQEGDDWKWLMQSKRGRRIVWGLLERAGIFRTSFVGSTNETMFREGERNLGLVLFDQVMTHTPEQYLAMTTENKNGA